MKSILTWTESIRIASSRTGVRVGSPCHLQCEFFIYKGSYASGFNTAAATPVAIWEYNENVVKDRAATIDFCSGLEHRDMGH